MLQEMELHKALKAFIAGKKVLVLQPPFTDHVPEDKDWMIDDLVDVFTGCRLLVDVPATIDPEFEEALTPVPVAPSPPQHVRPPAMWVPVPNGNR